MVQQLASASASYTQAVTSEAARELARSTLRKITRRLVPFLAILCVVNYLDRVNVGFAALQMNRDLHFSPAVYGFGAGIFFIGYALFEIPSNLVLYRVGARRWIARIMITWGFLSGAMVLARSPWSFYLLRFLLGVAEAGFFPGVIFYLTSWFPAIERARAVARFTIAVPLSFVVGGPLAGVLLSLDGRLTLRGWQWLFLVEALPAVVLGGAVLWYLTDRPEEARWLAVKERAWLSAELEREQRERLTREEVHLRQALLHPAVWVLALVNFGITTGAQSLALWVPQILRARSSLIDVWIGVLSAIPYGAAAVASVLIGAHSDRTRERIYHVAGVVLCGALGFLLCAVVGSPALSVVAISLAASGVFGRWGPFWALPAEFLHGRAAAGSIAMINAVGMLGGFVGTYAAGILNNRTASFAGGLLLWGVASVFASALMLAFPRASRSSRLAARPLRRPPSTE